MTRKRKWFCSILALLFISCIIGIMLILPMSLKRIRASQMQVMGNGFEAACSWLNNELDAMKDVASSLSVNSKYHTARLFADKSHEIDILNDFKSLKSRLEITDNYCLIYANEPEWIFVSDGRKWTWDVWMRTLVNMSAEKALQFKNELMECSAFAVIKTDAGCQLFAYPLFMYGKDRIHPQAYFVFAVQDKAVINGIDTILGSWQPFVKLTHNGETLLTAGEFSKNSVAFSRLLYDGEFCLDISMPWVNSLLWSGRPSLLEALFCLAAFVLLALLALLASSRAIKPFYNMISLFPATKTDEKDELKALERLITQELNVGEKVRKELKQRIVRQVITEPFSGNTGEWKEYLGIRDEEECFYIAVIEGAEGLENRGNMCRLLNDFSNSHYVFSPAEMPSAGVIAVLVALDSPDERDSSVEILQSLADEYSASMRTGETIVDVEELPRSYGWLMREKTAAENAGRIDAASELSLRMTDSNGTEEIGARVAAYISDHFGDTGISLKLLSGMFGITADYISQNVHKYTGLTYKAYLTKLRMEYAQKLLFETDLPVKQIGEQVGYARASNFINQFKETTGMTPLIYRKQGKENVE